MHLEESNRGRSSSSRSCSRRRCLTNPSKKKRSGGGGKVEEEIEGGDETEEEMEGREEETYLLLSSSPPAPRGRQRRRRLPREELSKTAAASPSVPCVRVVPRYRGVVHYSGGSGWIRVGQKPIPTLPNAFSGPPGEFTPAWAQFRSSRVFGPIPPHSQVTQTRAP
jgi:hypothetical protein